MNQWKLILILIDVQYLQNVVFYFDKGLNDQMHSSSDVHHLIKISTPSKIFHSPSTTGDFLASSAPLCHLETLMSDISRGFLAYRYRIFL